MNATESALRIVTNHQPPLVYVAAGQNGSCNSYSGYLVDLLPVLLQTAGINQSYIFYTVEGSGGVQLPNGSWTAIMGELSTARADLALFPLTLTAARQPYIQHTQPFMDGGYGILVQVATFKSGYSFLVPFGALTWGMFFVALLCTVLLLVTLDLITGHARLKAVEKALGQAKKHKMQKREEGMNHPVETVMMAVGSGSAPRSHSVSVKFLFVAWAVFCVIMLSAYTANLTANLTVNQLTAPVQSLMDLARTSAKFAVPSDSAVEAYFTGSMDKSVRTLRPQMIPYVSTDQAAEDVRAGKIAALIGDYVNVQYLTQKSPCGLALSHEVVGSGSLVLGLHPNSTLAPMLNTALLQLGEAGTTGDTGEPGTACACTNYSQNSTAPELKRTWFAEHNECADNMPAADKSGRIGMSQVWSVFLVLAAGAAAGVIVAVLEVVYYSKLLIGIRKFRHTVSARHREMRQPGAALQVDTAGRPSIHMARDIESPEAVTETNRSMQQALDQHDW